MCSCLSSSRMKGMPLSFRIIDKEVYEYTLEKLSRFVLMTGSTAVRYLSKIFHRVYYLVLQTCGHIGNYAYTIGMKN